MSTIQIIPIERVPTISEGDRLGKILVDSAKRQGTPFDERDIVIVTHKIVSKAEGRTINLDTISPSVQAKELAEKTGKDPALVEAVLNETKEIIRVGRNSIITENKNGVICANAGIDKSNVAGRRNVVLLPKDPDKSAQVIRDDIRRLTNHEVAVIVSDTNGRPLRMGEINVAIGIAGIHATRDRRGEKDLFGYVLRIKQTAIADELASAAELVIGQANEGIPAAIIRGYPYKTGEAVSARDLARPKETDLFREGKPQIPDIYGKGKSRKSV